MSLFKPLNIICWPSKKVRKEGKYLKGCREIYNSSCNFVGVFIFIKVLEYRGAQAPLFLAPAEGCFGAFGPSGRPLASSWGLRPLHRT